MKIKSFICGFLTSCLLLTGIYVFADTGFIRQITANIGGVDIVLDGTKLAPKDGNGKLVPPIAFEGTTYVPIRYLTAALGKSLVRSGNTIYFGEQTKLTSIYLSELSPSLKSENWTKYGLMGGWVTTVNPYNKQYSSVAYSKAGKMIMLGKEYTSVSTIQADGIEETWGLYNVDGKYSKISGYFGIDDSSTDLGQVNGQVEFYADNVMIKRIMMSRGQEPEKFELDLKGVKILNIKVKGACTYNNFSGVLLPTSQTICNLFDIKLHY